MEDDAEGDEDGNNRGGDESDEKADEDMKEYEGHGGIEVRSDRGGMLFL